MRERERERVIAGNKKKKKQQKILWKAGKMAGVLR